MKNIAIFFACSLALALVFYEIADYLTPGSPSAEVTLMLIGLAVVLVWVVQCGIRVSRPKKNGAHAVR